MYDVEIELFKRSGADAGVGLKLGDGDVWGLMV